MFGFREKLFRAIQFLCGGILILVLWSVVYADYHSIIFNKDHIEEIPMDVLGLLFEYYLVPTIGGSFCIIGIAGLIITLSRHFLAKNQKSS